MGHSLRILFSRKMTAKPLKTQIAEMIGNGRLHTHLL